MRRPATDAAREWLDNEPIFLDTETTGLRADAEICEITLMNYDGTVLLDTLVNPMRSIPGNATAIHGITNATVKDAPTFREILPRLNELLTGREVIIYNARYDQKMLVQSAAAHGIALAPWWRPQAAGERAESIPQWHCAMKLYAEYHGDWDEYRQNFRWQRLGNAARQCRLEIPTNLHRARADAELTRRLVFHMAERAI